MFKVNNKDTGTTSCRSGVFIVNFQHTSHLFQELTPFSRVSIVDFEQVNIF